MGEISTFQHEAALSQYTEPDARGVCAGLGDHLDVDPSMIRLIWVAVTILSIGVGIIVCVIAVIIVPEEPGAGEIIPVQPVRPEDGRRN
jgi:phage shock protein PspC (stress-responsive transcriptional regulator)